MSRAFGAFPEEWIRGRIADTDRRAGDQLRPDRTNAWNRVCTGCTESPARVVE